MAKLRAHVSMKVELWGKKLVWEDDNSCGDCSIHGQSVRVHERRLGSTGFGRKESGKRKTRAGKLKNSLPVLRMSGPWDTNKEAHKNRIRGAKKTKRTS